MDEDTGGAVAPVQRISGAGVRPVFPLLALAAGAAGIGMLLFGGKKAERWGVYLLVGGVAMAIRAVSAQAGGPPVSAPGESMYEGGRFAPGSGAGR